MFILYNVAKLSLDIFEKLLGESYSSNCENRKLLETSHWNYFWSMHAVFGSVFWNTATEDYYNKLNGETYQIDNCLQYMEPPLSSMEERDDCNQKRQLGSLHYSWYN